MSQEEEVIDIPTELHDIEEADSIEGMAAKLK